MTKLQNSESAAAADVPFDPRAYTVVIRRVVRERKPAFHGRVIELPDLEAFEPSYQTAYDFLIDGIETAKEAFDEQGRSFPVPLPDDVSEYSGRATIRMPTWLHARLDHCARVDETSLNQYMVALLSWAVDAAPRWTPTTQMQMSGGAMAEGVAIIGSSPTFYGTYAWDPGANVRALTEIYGDAFVRATSAMAGAAVQDIVVDLRDDMSFGSYPKANIVVTAGKATSRKAVFPKTKRVTG